MTPYFLKGLKFLLKNLPVFKIKSDIYITTKKVFTNNPWDN
jgi:hypothetical protein